MFLTLLGTVIQPKEKTTARVLNSLIKVLAYVPLIYAVVLLAFRLRRRIGCLVPQPVGDDHDQSNQDSQLLTPESTTDPE